MKFEHLRFYRILPQVFVNLEQNNLESFFDLVELFKVGLVDKDRAEEIKHYTKVMAGATVCHIGLSAFYKSLLSVSFNCSGYIALSSECSLYLQTQSPPKTMFATVHYSRDENLANMNSHKSLYFGTPLQ